MAESLFPTFAAALRRGERIALVSRLDAAGAGRKLLVWPDGRVQGSLGGSALDDTVRRLVQERFQERPTNERLSLPGPEGEADLLVEFHEPQPVLVIVGAVHIAIPLVTFARTLGFRTVVVDARTAFATPERFAHADELRIGWPADILAQLPLHESTYVVTLTHDEKLDNPALAAALTRPVPYIGALGSRKTHAKRVAALRQEGFTDAEIARIHAPVGLDLGGRSPEEIALAIMAEIVAVRNNA